MKQTASSRFVFTAAWVSAAISLASFLAPLYVIRPFRTQTGDEIAFAMRVHEVGPVISAVSLIATIALVFLAWREGNRSRAGLVICLLVSLTGAIFTRINVFEMVFHPYLSAAFVSPETVKLDDDEMVMSVTIAGQTHAYPINAVGYHHIVNDVVGGIPVAATYCTLCHTGIVWKRVLDGRVLTFRLAGIRDDNALLSDEETNSIWQQSTGLAIYGPLKGKQLEVMHSDELTFALWRSEQPRGLILKPNIESASHYEKKDWEKDVEGNPYAIDTAKTGLKPRELTLGIETGGASKAFSMKAVLSAKLIQDHVGEDAVILVVGPDNASVRAFRTQPNRTFLRAAPGVNGVMTDAETASAWNFSGCAVGGPLTGECLQPLDVVKDYWFDWLNHHPSTTVLRN